MALMILITNYILLFFFYFPEKLVGKLSVEIEIIDIETILFTLFVLWQTYILLRKSTREVYYPST